MSENDKAARRRYRAELRHVGRAILRSIEDGDKRVALLGQKECDAGETFNAWLGYPLDDATYKRTLEFTKLPSRVFAWRLLSTLSGVELPIEILAHDTAVNPPTSTTTEHTPPHDTPAIPQETLNRTVAHPDLARVHTALASVGVPVYTGTAQGVAAYIDDVGWWALHWHTPRGSVRQADADQQLNRALSALCIRDINAYIVRKESDGPTPTQDTTWAVGDRFRLRGSGTEGEVLSIDAPHNARTRLDNSSVDVLVTFRTLTLAAERIHGDGPTPTNDDGVQVAPTGDDRERRLSVLAGAVLYVLRTLRARTGAWGQTIVPQLRRLGYTVTDDAWAHVVAQIVGAGFEVSAQQVGGDVHIKLLEGKHT